MQLMQTKRKIVLVRPATSESISLRHGVALVATGALAIAIVYLTLSPLQPTKLGGYVSDKAYHFIAFAALAFPTALLYARSLVWIIPAALLLGGIIELVQPYVGRSREGADWIADAFGIGFGVSIGLVIRKIIRKKN
ncbi:hypothetical protein SAMN05444000_12918 [Shimia gijangensis]|uniref:VanZ like family protein n=1 Tax=Shimia gijangensis TaxID=1470563 RepID=A0A1M6SG13_9RHOB|nr:VanZ family protein [Shimia gijangensis]SHK43438.1 hypothetical protein SAMN05444000_12918 [Shimia gijangensis]